MAGDAADPAAATDSRVGEIEMRIIGLGTPERLVLSLRTVEEREIEVAMEDVTSRQGDVLLEVER
ncbi:MAG: hypothetical protein DVB27_15010 [Verrucomicrobia bacterium]|nr:MAG: hypothetical protein DVB27_15010 [Verrucomicrobiota bacterium]